MVIQQELFLPEELLTTEQAERVRVMREEQMYTVHHTPVALGWGSTMLQCTPPESGYRFYMIPGVEKDLTSVTTLVEGTIRNRHLEDWKLNTINKQLEKRLNKKLSAKQVELVMGEGKKLGEHGAHLGNEVHSMVDSLLKGDSPVIPEFFEPAIDGWLKWRQTHANWSWLGSEVGICDVDGGYAGTVDAIFWDNDKQEYIICDWKTSSGIFESMPLQLAGYALALERMGREIEVPLPTIRAMVVRIKSDYPSEKVETVSKNGNTYMKKVRLPDSEYDKFFLPRVEEAWVDRSHWDGMFRNTLGLYHGLREKIKKEHIK